MPENTDKNYFEDLLDDELFDDEELDEEDESQEEEPDEDSKNEDDKDKDLTDEEQRRKNKDAEEARKRREAEAKAKAEEEAKAKEEADKKAAEEKAKADAEAKAEAEKTKKQNALGTQLFDFKQKYPDIDLAALDNDSAFKKFINGKLLGKQDFIAIYEDYVETRGEITGQTREQTQALYKLKAQVSTGSTTGTTKPGVKDVYSEDEMKKLAERLPFMSRKEAEAVSDKIERSIAYYNKK